MARKKPITNTEALEKLETAGVITKWKLEDLKEGEDNIYCKIHHGDYLKYYTPPRNNSTYSYHIPVHIWKQYVHKRFGNKFNVGDMIRVTQDSKRAYERSKWSQDTGDSQDFRHLGIGTGKVYLSDDQIEAIQESNYRYSYRYAYRNNLEHYRIKIGNNNYPLNTLAAISKQRFLDKMGVKIPKRFSWDQERSIPLNELLDYTHIQGHGLLGYKRVVNGWVWEAYVHFLYPKWEAKRETRYMIRFENGASGVWTDDYMHRVYDTDIDYGQENLMVGCESANENCGEYCIHAIEHIEQHECDYPCNLSKTKHCKPVFNYDNLWDFTHGTALDIEKEEKDKKS